MDQALKTQDSAPTSQATNGANHQLIVKLNLPFGVERRGKPEREQVLGWDSQKSMSYLQALGREIVSNAGQFDDCEAMAVRLGGGIATNTPGQALAEVFAALKRTVHIPDGISITARAAIHNVSGASMPWLRRIGVTRFDFEIMSLDSSDFERLNRCENLSVLPYVVDSFLHAQTRNNLGYILAYGFDAPNTASFRRSIIEFTRCPARHLILERWQGWSDPQAPAKVGKASADLEAQQLGEAREVLAEAGYVEYVPLAFARPGDEDPYLQLHARKADELQFGLGAHTRFGGALSTNTSDWDLYLAHSNDFSQITTSVEKVG